MCFSLKVASGCSFEFTNFPEDGCLHYKGSDMTRMIAYLQHLTPSVSLADVLFKSVATKPSRHIFNIICSVHRECNLPHTPTNAQLIENCKSIIYMNSPTCFSDIATCNMHSGTSTNCIQDYANITAAIMLMFLYL
jgi:hypothetical protein